MERSGTELARGYYQDVVAPILEARYPGLPYAAARLGSGSDVLGLDDATSRDHDWGLRLTLLVDVGVVDDVRRHLEEVLPPSYAGWPTRFATTWEPAQTMKVQVEGPVEFVRSRIGFDLSDGLTVVGWLALTGQSVLEVTAGEVFADTDGALTAMRAQLSWYPDDLWCYVVAADWSRLAQELPLASRAGERGDELGSRVVMSRQVRTAVHLAFLLERRWPPYSKWLGTVFATLPLAGAVGPGLRTALEAASWQEREAGLVDALDSLLGIQRAGGLPTPTTVVEPFYDRPQRGIRGQVVQRLLASIDDPEVCRLPPGVGSVEQWVDNVDVLVDHGRRLAAVEAMAGER